MSVAALTVSPSMLRLLRLGSGELRTPLLTQSAADVLGGLLIYEGFDLARPIHVQELPREEGFVLTQ